MKLRSSHKAARIERLKQLTPLFAKAQRASLEIIRKQNEDYKMNKIIQEVLSSEVPDEIKRENAKVRRKRTSAHIHGVKIPKKTKFKSRSIIDSDESDSADSILGKRQQNGIRSDADEPDLCEMEHKYAKWRKNEFDTYNCVNRQVVISNIEYLKKQMATKKSEPKCSMSSDNSEIMWSSSTYIIKYIRMCILRHDWKKLSGLIRLMLHHGRRFHPYVKEMTFFAALMCDADSDIDLLKELDLCFAKVELQAKINPLDIWYVEDTSAGL